MKRILLTSLSLLLIVTALPAQTASDAPELTKLLNDFLAAPHTELQQFFADQKF